jgi:membrane protease YdiL (CAAX protease family)
LSPAPNENKSSRWRLLGRVMLYFLSCAFLLAATSSITQRIPGQWGNFVLGSVAALGAFALTVVFVRWEGISLESVGAALARGSLLRFASGFLVGLVLVAIYTLISAVAGHVRWTRAPGNGFAIAMMSLLTFLAISCREEVAFRGYPLLRLNKSFGVWGAQIIVALVFAAEHMAGGWPLSRALLGAGVGSLMFGMAAIATRGLAVPIGLHAAWNFGDWILGGKGSPGLWQVVVEEGHQQRAQLIGTIGYLAVMTLATFTLWIWYRSKAKLQLQT